MNDSSAGSSVNNGLIEGEPPHQPDEVHIVGEGNETAENVPQQPDAGIKCCEDSTPVSAFEPFDLSTPGGRLSVFETHSADCPLRKIYCQIGAFHFTKEETDILENKFRKDPRPSCAMKFLFTKTPKWLELVNKDVTVLRKWFCLRRHVQGLLDASCLKAKHATGRNLLVAISQKFPKFQNYGKPDIAIATQMDKHETSLWFHSERQRKLKQEFYRDQFSIVEPDRETEVTRPSEIWLEEERRARITDYLLGIILLHILPPTMRILEEHFLNTDGIHLNHVAYLALNANITPDQVVRYMQMRFETNSYFGVRNDEYRRHFSEMSPYYSYLNDQPILSLTKRSFESVLREQCILTIRESSAEGVSDPMDINEEAIQNVLKKYGLEVMQRAIDISNVEFIADNPDFEQRKDNFVSVADQTLKEFLKVHTSPIDSSVSSQISLVGSNLPVQDDRVSNDEKMKEKKKRSSFHDASTSGSSSNINENNRVVLNNAVDFDDVSNQDDESEEDVAMDALNHTSTSQPESSSPLPKVHTDVEASTTIKDALQSLFEEPARHLDESLVDSSLSSTVTKSESQMAACGESADSVPIQDEKKMEHVAMDVSNHVSSTQSETPSPIPKVSNDLDSPKTAPEAYQSIQDIPEGAPIGKVPSVDDLTSSNADDPIELERPTNSDEPIRMDPNDAVYFDDALNTRDEEETKQVAVDVFKHTSTTTQSESSIPVPKVSTDLDSLGNVLGTHQSLQEQPKEDFNGKSPLLDDSMSSHVDAPAEPGSSTKADHLIQGVAHGQAGSYGVPNQDADKKKAVAVKVPTASTLSKNCSSLSKVSPRVDSPNMYLLALQSLQGKLEVPVKPSLKAPVGQSLEAPVKPSQLNDSLSSNANASTGCGSSSKVGSEGFNTVNEIIEIVAHGRKRAGELDDAPPEKILRRDDAPVSAIISTKESEVPVEQKVAKRLEEEKTVGQGQMIDGEEAMDFKEQSGRSNVNRDFNSPFSVKNLLAEVSTEVSHGNRQSVIGSESSNHESSISTTAPAPAINAVEQLTPSSFSSYFQRIPSSAFRPYQRNRLALNQTAVVSTSIQSESTPTWTAGIHATQRSIVTTQRSSQVRHMDVDSDGEGPSSSGAMSVDSQATNTCSSGSVSQRTSPNSTSPQLYSILLEVFQNLQRTFGYSGGLLFQTVFGQTSTAPRQSVASLSGQRLAEVVHPSTSSLQSTDSALNAGSVTADSREATVDSPQSSQDSTAPSSSAPQEQDIGQCETEDEGILEKPSLIRQSQLDWNRAVAHGQWFAGCYLPFDNSPDYRQWTPQQIQQFGCQFLPRGALQVLRDQKIGGEQMILFHSRSMEFFKKLNDMGPTSFAWNDFLEVSRHIAHIDEYCKMKKRETIMTAFLGKPQENQ